MILVVGSGGNGQTYFMQFLRKNGINTNILVDGRKSGDNLKHLPNPNLLKSRLAKQDIYNDVVVKKCIFLYNHPYYSLLSHYRRKWAYRQCCKLGNPKSLTIDNVNNFNNIKERTFKVNKDIFGFAFQFKNWIVETQKNNNLDILFLDFNDVLNERDRLNAFVGKELNYDLFTIKERSTSGIHYKRLYIIYDNLYKYMKKQINMRRKREALALSNPDAYEKMMTRVRAQKKENAKNKNKNKNKNKCESGTTCSIKKSSCTDKKCVDKKCGMR